MENRHDSYLGRTGAVIAPAFEPLGFGNWEAASSLLTGIVAKEIVVGTMGEVYAPHLSIEAGSRPSLKAELRNIVSSFGDACRDAVANVVATFSVGSLAAEDDRTETTLKTAVRQAFTPLSAYAFMVFVLLYTPCVVVAIAMRQEFGAWKLAGLAFCYQTALAWGVALVIYQAGQFFGVEG